jgi:hypothetical protein
MPDKTDSKHGDVSPELDKLIAAPELSRGESRGISSRQRGFGFVEQMGLEVTESEGRQPGDQSGLDTKALPKIPGLLPVPEEVLRLVEAEEQGFFEQQHERFAPEAKQRIINDETLDHYFHNQWVSYRETGQGVEVLAVGLDSIGRALPELTPEELQSTLTRRI